jgi:hypothetical protein
LTIVALFMGMVSLFSGCSLLLGGATGAGVGALAGKYDGYEGRLCLSVGGAGDAAGGALLGAAVGNPLVVAVAGGLGSAATGDEVKKNSSGE